MSAARNVVVVGGGLAGAAAAILLTRAGQITTLLEKSKGPHDKVCGEFLSHEALHYLRGLGVEVRALGAVPLGRVRLFGRRLLTEAPLPFAACSLSRRVLDEALLGRAAEEGVEVLRERHVEQISPAAEGWRIDLRGREPVGTEDVFLASGKHDVRGKARSAGTHAGLVGFKMHFRLQQKEHAALGDAVELMLFPGGYAGLQPIEDGCANLCLLVAAKTLRSLGGRWSDVQKHLREASPALAQRLDQAEPLFAAPLTVAAVPYGFLQRHSDDGLWRVGDQAAVIPSFSGDGMAIALHSGVFAARRYASGQTAEAFQRELAAQLRVRLRVATTISQMLVEHPWLAQVARVWPTLLPHVAVMTRIRRAALIAAEPAVHG